MTELELLNHAKSYIDQLVKGIDPISGNEVPGNSVLNQERLSKCFAYVSDVLLKVIDNNGEIKAKESQRTRKFSLNEELRPLVPLSDDPISITVFCNNINETISDPKMKLLKPSKITDWLLLKGFLAVETQDNGKNQRVPTEAGFKVGISTRESRNKPYGINQINLYDKKAQEFILLNLEEMLQK